MKKYDFQTILECLSIGQEIEFSYKGKLYSITNDSSGYWNFCCGSTLVKALCEFDDKDRLIQRVSDLSIDGVNLSSIFDDAKYENSSVMIL